ncbi:MAG: tRNA 2-thiouridine synthesizing protein D [Chlamydiales bacterium]|jgi:tRNA 2-thiouridine synthesizing protein D
MSDNKSLSLMIMDPPYESSNTMTALRIVESALKKGIDVNVFAFEGAVNLSFAAQKAHPNPVKASSADEEKHPLTREFVSGLFATAAQSGAKLDWVNCGFCVDERGAEPWVEGPRRGGPPDFAKFFAESDQTLVIATK